MVRLYRIGKQFCIGFDGKRYAVVSSVHWQTNVSKIGFVLRTNSEPVYHRFCLETDSRFGFSACNVTSKPLLFPKPRTKHWLHLNYIYSFFSAICISIRWARLFQLFIWLWTIIYNDGLQLPVHFWQNKLILRIRLLIKMKNSIIKINLNVLSLMLSLMCKSKYQKLELDDILINVFSQ